MQPIIRIIHLTFLVIIIILISCHDQNKTGAQGNELMTVKNDKIKPLEIDTAGEGWGADIKLSIIETQQSDSSQTYKAVSSYQEKTLGLIIVIPNKDKSRGFGQGIVLKSIGVESDQLLQQLAKLYKQNTGPSLKFISSISLSYLNMNEFVKSLGGDADDRLREYKVFFENREGDEAELYLNVNPAEGWIQLAEKDEEYRAQIIHFLSQPLK